MSDRRQYFASPFMLKVDGSEKHLRAAPSTLTCEASGVLETSSLITFHGPLADQVNYQGDSEPPRAVRPGDIVTLFGNVLPDGRYLSVRSNNSTAWDGRPEDLQGEDSSAFEYIVHLVSRNNISYNTHIMPKASKNRLISTLRSKVSKARRYSVAKSPSDLSRASAFTFGASQKKRNTNCGEVEPVTVEADEDQILAANNNINIVNVRKTKIEKEKESFFNKMMKSFNMNSSSSRRPEKSKKKFSDLDFMSTPNSTRSFRETRELIPSFRSVNTQNQFVQLQHNAVTNPTLMARPRFSQKASEGDDQEANEFMQLNDIISLESRKKPGYYLHTNSFGSNSTVFLRKGKPSNFVLIYPELNHVLVLNRENQHKMLFSTDPRHNNVGRSRNHGDKAVFSPRDYLFKNIFSNLPHDLIFEIIQYLPHWFEMARYFNRSWKLSAERHIKKIKIVNCSDLENNFAFRKQQLFRLIAACENLREITFRSLDGLSDQDIHLFKPMRSLTCLSVGGCTQLTDKFIHGLGKFPNLTTLNVAVTQVTDAGLLKIPEVCPKLTYLNIYRCKNVTLFGIEYCINKLRFLDNFNIRGTTVARVPERYNRTRVSVLIGPAEPEDIYS